MKNIIIVFCGIIVVLLNSCSSDKITYPPLSAIVGEYEGKYIIKTDYQQPTEISSEYNIIFRFSEKYYWITSLQNTLCSPTGSFSYDVNVTLTELIDGCNNLISTGDRNPTGVFQIEILTDSLIMIQLSNDTLKVLRLLKTSD